MVRTFRNAVAALTIAAALSPTALPAHQPATTSEADSAAPAASPTDAASKAAPSPLSLAALVEHLSVDSRKKFGEMLQKDWPDRPEWADMLIVLLKGENMGPGAGWFKPSQKKYDWPWISDRFDADSDGKVTAEELGVKDPGSDQFFSRLDRDNDGVLRQGDFDYFGRQQATPPLLMSQYLPGLFDSDTNGRITPEELLAFLKRADEDKTGFITSEDLYRAFSKYFADRESEPNDMPRPERMLPMFLKGEFGVFEAGPALGETAPDFTLPAHDGSQTVTLSQTRGKPVILIFGSFT